ncbi:Arc-like DNA binding dprotein [Agrobacterium vitis]|nr:Arc-like DNA binding dprotein [Agrobacterium vitis]
MSAERQFRQNESQYILRFPEGMRQMIKIKAAENGRSMNAEIIFQLKAAYGAENEKSGTTA